MNDTSVFLIDIMDALMDEILELRGRENWIIIKLVSALSIVLITFFTFFTWFINFSFDGRLNATKAELNMHKDKQNIHFINKK